MSNACPSPDYLFPCVLKTLFNFGLPVLIGNWYIVKSICKTLCKIRKSGNLKIINRGTISYKWYIFIYHISDILICITKNDLILMILWCCQLLISFISKLLIGSDSSFILFCRAQNSVQIIISFRLTNDITTQNEHWWVLYKNSID